MKSKRQLKSEAFLASKRAKPLSHKEKSIRAKYGAGFLKAFGHRFVQPSVNY